MKSFQIKHFLFVVYGLNLNFNYFSALPTQDLTSTNEGHFTSDEVKVPTVATIVSNVSSEITSNYTSATSNTSSNEISENNKSTISNSSTKEILVNSTSGRDFTGRMSKFSVLCSNGIVDNNVTSDYIRRNIEKIIEILMYLSKKCDSLLKEKEQKWSQRWANLTQLRNLPLKEFPSDLQKNLELPKDAFYKTAYEQIFIVSKFTEKLKNVGEFKHSLLKKIESKITTVLRKIKCLFCGSGDAFVTGTPSLNFLYASPFLQYMWNYRILHHNADFFKQIIHIFITYYQHFQ